MTIVLPSGEKAAEPGFRGLTEVSGYKAKVVLGVHFALLHRTNQLRGRIFRKHYPGTHVTVLMSSKKPLHLDQETMQVDDNQKLTTLAITGQREEDNGWQHTINRCQ